jgi:hypothetical protein
MNRDVSLTVLAEVLTQIARESGNEERSPREFVSIANSLIHRLPPDLHEDAYAVLPNVDHFIADLDIRRKDEAYKTMQHTHMNRLIDALRSGAPRDQLLQYSFLTKPE